MPVVAESASFIHCLTVDGGLMCQLHCVPGHRELWIFVFVFFSPARTDLLEIPPRNTRFTCTKLTLTGLETLTELHRLRHERFFTKNGGRHHHQSHAYKNVTKPQAL